MPCSTEHAAVSADNDDHYDDDQPQVADHNGENKDAVESEQGETPEQTGLVNHEARHTVLRGFIEAEYADDPQGLHYFLSRAFGREEKAVLEHCKRMNYKPDRLLSVIRRL